MKKIALFGYSGHAIVVAEAIQLSGYEIIGYYDKTECDLNLFNIPYLGFEGHDKVLQQVKSSAVCFFVCIGDNLIRRRLSELLQTQGLKSPLICHPYSFVSSLASIGQGTFIAVRAIVNPLAKVGKGVILNSGAIVEHDCKVGDYTQLASGAILSGGVRVGENSFIGANAVIKQGLQIGSNVIIGAGAVVLQDVPDGQTWVGNPAKNMVKDIQPRVFSI